ncbi:MAG: hypothetical protein QXK71_00390 [Pyrobaculum sp.]
MDIVSVLKSRDLEKIKEALVEVHKAKAFSLADSEYIEKELENAARYHAYHIALISSLIYDVEVDLESITGRDYLLAKSFREAESKCELLSIDTGDEFYKTVVEELNNLLSTLCPKSPVD